MNDLSHARDGLDALGIMLYGHVPVPREWVGGPDAKILHDAADRIRELEKLSAFHIEQAKKGDDLLLKRIRELTERTEAAEAKLERIDSLNPMFDLETEGEFHRGQVSGWNQCISSVQAALQEQASVISDDTPRESVNTL